MVKKKNDDRITVEALRYYVPIFQKGDEAEKMLQADRFTGAERTRLESIAGMKELALNRIAKLSSPLITREIQKIISGSHLRNQEDNLFPILYYAGMDGLEKGLRKFDVEKMSTISSTNYLFQWITVYAKKELLTLEAPMGVAPSRFQRYKKISAVRKRMTEENYGVEPTDMEVYEYFQSGRADQRNMNGRKVNAGKPSEANRKITLELIQEQREVEKNLNFAPILDVAEDFRAEARLSTKDKAPFSQTIFGIFLNERKFTSEATAVLKSELKYELDLSESEALIDLSNKEYRSISTQWKDLMRSKNGPFYVFLKAIPIDENDEFNVKRTIANIESHGKIIPETKYISLFERENK